MTKIPSVEERVAEFRKIISEKHGGLGLCDYMFENTIVPFLTQALTAEREAGAREERKKCIAEMKIHKQNNKFITITGTLQMMGMIELIETGALTPPNK